VDHPAQLSEEQAILASLPLDASAFLEGPAGTGKTTAGVERLLTLLANGIDGQNILVLVPQRTLAFPYYQAMEGPDLPYGGLPTVATLGGIARRSIELFWPLIAAQAGFHNPNNLPTFLTLETSQYYMAHLVAPLLEKGYFDSLTIDRNRLFSQIIDNLNKAAAIGIPHTVIGERLKTAWVGEPTQLRVYEEAQECANLFRLYCLENNLLDFSLQMEIFHSILFPSNEFRQYFLRDYRHLIFDNVEEDTPIVHETVTSLLPDLDSSLLIYDTDGGYRSFLGADPGSGYHLKMQCAQHFVFDQSFVTTPVLDNLRKTLSACINRQEAAPTPEIHDILEFNYLNYQPQMVDEITRKIASLVNEGGYQPGDIAILAPFMSDALRFSISTSLDQLDIPSRSHRPSRSLQDEPATNCLLTIARLAHPQWALYPHQHEIRSMLMDAIEGMDLVRADLLARIAWSDTHPEKGLSDFSDIKPFMQERITYQIGERFGTLRKWIEDYQENPAEELDVCLSRIFGDLLSQPGFGFYGSFEKAGITARLLESIQKFRRVINPNSGQLPYPTGKEYIKMVQSGIMAAQYLGDWQDATDDAVLLAPAYTFLMTNRPAKVQFWLEIGSMGWWERLYQPLTHPFVLSRQWDGESIWTDVEERASNRHSLDRLVNGLIRRCSDRIYLYTTSMDSQGREQRSELLHAVQILMRRIHAVGGDHV
jgi:hypothetical protein